MIPIAIITYLLFAIIRSLLPDPGRPGYWRQCGDDRLCKTCLQPYIAAAANSSYYDSSTSSSGSSSSSDYDYGDSSSKDDDSSSKRDWWKGWFG